MTLDVYAALAGTDADRERSGSGVGPSSFFGAECQAGRTFAGHPEVNEGVDKLPAILGTAIHSALEQALAGRGEHEITVTYAGITGHADFLPADEPDLLVDWKTTTLKKLPRIKAEGASLTYRAQASFYAMATGRTRVRIVYIPRDGGRKDIHAVEFDRDDALVDEAVAWYYALRARAAGRSPRRTRPGRRWRKRATSAPATAASSTGPAPGAAPGRTRPPSPRRASAGCSPLPRPPDRARIRTRKRTRMVNFSAPAAGGARIDWHSVKGNLLVLVPIDIKRDIPTKLGDPTDAIVADVHILDGDRAGDWEPGVWVFPKVLKAQLEPKVAADGSEMVLGRLGQEPTTKGSPAWKLADPTAADGEAAQRWYAWRLDKGLPITSVGKPIPAVAAEPTAATSFSPNAGTTLGEQVAASKANVAAASGTWPGAGAEPPF